MTRHSRLISLEAEELERLEQGIRAGSTPQQVVLRPKKEAEKGVRFYRLPRDSSRTRTAPCSTTNAPKGSSEEAGPPNILCDHSVVSQAPRAADSAARQNAPACARCFKFSAAGLRPPPPIEGRSRTSLSRGRSAGWTWQRPKKGSGFTVYLATPVAREPPPARPRTRRKEAARRPDRQTFFVTIQSSRRRLAPQILPHGRTLLRALGVSSSPPPASALRPPSKVGPAPAFLVAAARVGRGSVTTESACDRR